MNKQKIQQLQKKRRAHRTRNRIVGTPERPRLSVHRSLMHISAQLIDDTAGKTIAYTDDTKATGTKTERAQAVGKAIADAAKQKGVTAAVFDRGSYRYHGRVKALADSAREGGLQL